MSPRSQVRMVFCPPPADLAAFFTSFYRVDIAVAGDGEISDFLHPEWANLRFLSAPVVRAVGPESGIAVEGTRFIATGPSSRAVHFTTATVRLWGVGLLPLGWARFLGLPASELADAVLDGDTHPAMARFTPLTERLFAASPDPDSEHASIAEFFRGFPGGPLHDATRIQAIHAALVDPEVANVAQLVARAGASPRTVERLCCRHFGFPPKLLLRRQRFMRSLAQFMLDPSLRWIGAMDGHYHDQAQFVRDFHRFMGMSPRQYGALDHPVLDAFVHERSRLAGSAVQTLDLPRASPPLGHSGTHIAERGGAA